MEEFVLESAALYRNGRCHGVFSDHSAMILHPGGSFVTYFSRSGQAIRQVTSCVTSTESAKEKVIILLELVNSLALKPVTALAGLIYAKDLRLRERKSEMVAWMLPAVLTVVEGEGRRQIASVTFDHDKARNRVEVILDPSDGSLSLTSADKLARVSLSADGLLVKVTFPMFLPDKQVISKSEKTYRGAAGTGVVFQYIDMSQIFSSADYPEEWSRPVELLWHSFKALERTELRSPMFYTPPDGAEDIAGEFQTKLPAASGSGETWHMDTVSPAVSLFNYFESAVFAVWTAEATLRNVPNLGIEGVIHLDQARLLCVDGGFFHFLQANTSPRSFNKDAVPVIIRSKGGNYSLQRVVDDCMSILSHPAAPQRPAPLSPDHESVEDPEGVKCENVVEDLGTFTAYNDGSMRALFDDRTVIRINNDMSVTAISRKGEMLKLSLDNPYGYETYIPVCLEFYEWAFTSEEEKARKQVKEAELKLLTQIEMEKIDKLLGLDGRSFED